MYRKRVWRYVSASQYKSTNGYTYSELDSGFSINTCSLFSEKNSTPSIKSSRSNLLWSDASDFTYTGYSTVQLSYDSLSGKFTSLSTASNMYSTQVTATHKVSGRTTTFTLVVNPKAQFVGVVPIESNIERNSWFSPASSSLRAQGISEVNAEYDSFTIEEILNKLDNDNNFVFISRSHRYENKNIERQLEHTGIVITENEANPEETIFLTKYEMLDLKRE